MSSRPVYLNLLKIRLPLTGMVSFAHRVSGLLLFLAIPWSVYLLDLSVASSASFQNVIAMFDQPFTKLVLLVVLWSLAHHFFAGIRYLLIDAEIGIELAAAKLGAWLVIAAESVTVLILVWVLLL